MKNLSLLLMLFTLGSFTLVDAAGCCGQKKRKKESIIETIKRKISRIIRNSESEEVSESENMQEEQVVDQQKPQESVAQESVAQECVTQECEGEECPIVVTSEHDVLLQEAQKMRRNEIMEVVENVVSEVMEEQEEQLTPEELAIVVNSLVENIISQDQQEVQENA